jgi:hypothetical protein
MPSPWSLKLENAAIVCTHAQNERWRIPVSDLKIVGEHTNQSGPSGDDYFLAFVTRNDGTWFEVPFDAAGVSELLSQLGGNLGAQLELQLCNSADFKSRVMWPQAMMNEPMFEYRRSNGLLGRLKLRITQTLHKNVTSRLAANNSVDR